MFCPKCGNKAEEGSLFCGMCGAKIPQILTRKDHAPEDNETLEPGRDGPVPEDQGSINPKLPKKKKRKIGLWIFLGILFVIIVGLGYHAIAHYVAVREYQKVKPGDLDRLVRAINKNAESIQEYSDHYLNGRGDQDAASYAVDLEMEWNSIVIKHMDLRSAFTSFQNKKEWDAEKYEEYEKLYDSYRKLYDFYNSHKSADRESDEAAFEKLMREYREQYTKVLDMGTEKTAARTNEKAGGEPTASETAFNYSVDGMLLSSVADFYRYDRRIYDYDSSGLCSRMVTDDSSYDFSYRYDAQGKPVVRYYETDVAGDPVSVPIEWYDYYENGSLHHLLYVNDVDDLEPEDPEDLEDLNGLADMTYEDFEDLSYYDAAYMELDQNGRAVSAVGIETIPALGGTGFPLPWAKEISWYDDGKLKSITFPYAVELEILIRDYRDSRNLSDDHYGEIRDELLQLINENGIPEERIGPFFLGYTVATFHLDFEYDDHGRIIRRIDTKEKTPVYSYVYEGQEALTNIIINEYQFDYYDGLTFWFKDSRYREGYDWVEESGPVRGGYQVIRYDPSGLPISVNDTPLDIYDDLDCSVKNAEFGFYGVWWCKAFTDVYGEIHGGFAGIETYAYLSQMTSNNSLTLKITGTDEKGNILEYYSYPEQSGRGATLKLTNGMLSIPFTEYQDLTRAYEYYLEDDEDVFVYEPLK